MAGLVIVIVLGIAAIAFMAVFFVALRRDSQRKEECRVVRVDPSSLSAGFDQVMTGGATSQPAAPTFSAGDNDYQNSRVIEIPRRAKFVPPRAIRKQREH